MMFRQSFYQPGLKVKVAIGIGCIAVAVFSCSWEKGKSDD